MIFRSRRGKFTVIAISPAMVRATQKADVLAIGSAHAHTAVPAGIEECSDDSLVVANQYRRIETALSADQISWIGNFTFVTEEEPTTTKYAVDFHLINFRIGKDAARDQSLLRPHDRLEMLAVGKLGKSVQRRVTAGTVLRSSDGHGISPLAGYCVLPSGGRSASFRISISAVAAASAAAGSEAAIAST